MKTLKLVPALAAILLLQACASNQSKPSAAGSAEAAAVQPKPELKPMQVGPDITSPLKPAEIWAVLASLDNWGAWNKKVTKVDAGPGLNAGTRIRYAWEEREVDAVVEEVVENQVLTWKGARSGKDVLLRWQLRDSGGITSISLKAVLKPNAGATPIANAGAETSAWIGALQIELNRLYSAESAKKKPVKKPVSKP